MTIKIDPYALKTGDIVFVRNSEKTSILSRSGQDLLRLPSVASGKFQKAYYSHVMLGIFPGVIIHADGQLVKAECLVDYLDKNNITRENFKVIRNANLQSLENIEAKLITEAEKFINQKYSFVYGRRSSSIGKFIHRQRRTFPFCSELIASVYGAIGITICNRPYDKILPVDFEVHCVAPEWGDVTESFELPNFNHPFFEIPIEVNGQILSENKCFTQLSHLQYQLSDANVNQINIRHDFINNVLVLFINIEKLNHTELDFSKNIMQIPSLLFKEHIDLVLQDIESLPTFYDEMMSDLQVSPIANMIQDSFSSIDINLPLYESLPSLQEVRSLESHGKSIILAAKAIRLETILAGLAIGLGCPINIKDKSRFEGISGEDVASFLNVIPLLTEEDAHALQNIIEKMNLNLTEEENKSIQRICKNIVSLHCLLSLLLHRNNSQMQTSSV